MLRIQKLALASVAMALSLVADGSLAAPVQYNFGGVVDFGSLLGETYAGQFSFDDAALTGSGSEFLSVNTLSFNFLGNTFDQASAAASPEVAFFDGVFLGLNFSVSAFNPAFSTVPGFFDVSESYFAYDNGAGSAGYGSLNYTAVSAVPEPEAWSMVFSGLALVAYFTRRRAKV